jgi:hypothetical protein
MSNLATVLSDQGKYEEAREASTSARAEGEYEGRSEQNASARTTGSFRLMPQLPTGGLNDNADEIPSPCSNQPSQTASYSSCHLPRSIFPLKLTALERMVLVNNLRAIRQMTLLLHFESVSPPRVYLIESV